jgi:hypothetical protein
MESIDGSKDIVEKVLGEATKAESRLAGTKRCGKGRLGP